MPLRCLIALTELLISDEELEELELELELDLSEFVGDSLSPDGLAVHHKVLIVLVITNTYPCIAFFTSGISTRDNPNQDTILDSWSSTVTYERNIIKKISYLLSNFNLVSIVVFKR